MSKKYRHGYKPSNETVWLKLKCGGGAQWTTAHAWNSDQPGSLCGFSGCGCGTLVEAVGTTTNRTEASAWFKRPSKEVAR